MHCGKILNRNLHIKSYNFLTSICSGLHNIIHCHWNTGEGETLSTFENDCNTIEVKFIFFG